MTSWVFIKAKRLTASLEADVSAPELWIVGFYTPDGTWEPESDHDSTESAAQRVHYLNGGAERAISDLESAVRDGYWK